VKTGKNTGIFFRLSFLSIPIISLSVLLLGLVKCSDQKTEIPSEQIIENKNNVFGFCDDSLEQQSFSVRKNETLSDIFLNFGVPANNIVQIVNKSNEVIDVRKIIAGNTYYTFTKQDSLNTLACLVYEKNPVDFIVFDLLDSINVYENTKEVIIIENQKSAVIENSLYVSLMQSNASPELAVKLSQIFAWQIDFYHLQKGDYFKVIYEEKYVDSSLIGIGKINAAYFNQEGKEFYAIPFVQDSVFQYFDENGNSLRKAFLKAPLEFRRISSRFSRNRLHPILKTHRPHLGVDYAAPVGTPVRSTGDGVVIEAGYRGGNGKFIKIRHNSVYTTMYMHLSRFAKGIKKGTSVQQGKIIGYVGSSGLSTGPHLDYRFFINGKPVNPLKVELPPSHPVNEEMRAEFEAVKDSTIKRLNKIEINLTEKPV
jgi:murein DD-endopeptidase MepM/ murein hydrolase activator NlpD